MRKLYVLILIASFVILSGCTTPRIKLYPTQADPLHEFTLQGEAKGKVAVIPIRSIISDEPKEQFFRTMPSMVQEFISQLNLAEKDKDVKAVLIKVDSPGGTVTASDILYKEISAFKKRTQKKIVVAMMSVAASGGYYISLPADHIMAHPTTVTGSIGVIFYRPKLTGLMGKIGVDVEVNKSGKNKDMGSPFRQTSREEENILQDLTDQLGKRFSDLVASHRQLDKMTLAEVLTGRVYLADQALELGLVDQIGYLEDAVVKAKELAGLPQDAKVVVYRRTEYPDDNLYNTSTTRFEGKGFPLISVDVLDAMPGLQTGFYYLWAPAVNLE
jgi:protease-4